MLEWKPAAACQPQVHSVTQGQGPTAPGPPPASRPWELLFGWGSREGVKLNDLRVLGCKKASTEGTQNLCVSEGPRTANQLFSVPLKKK